MNRRLTQRGQQRRRQIMDDATARFARSGYHQTSVADIVEGIGVGKGVFYWYFASKEEMFIEILREAQRDLRRTQQSALEGETDPIHQIELGIRATMAWSAKHRDVNRLIAFAATEAEFAAALRKGREVAAGDVIGIIRRGIDEGRIRDGDPEVIAHAVLGTTAYLTQVFLQERKRLPEEIADEAVAFCLEGLVIPEPVR